MVVTGDPRAGGAAVSGRRLQRHVPPNGQLVRIGRVSAGTVAVTAPRPDVETVAHAGDAVLGPVLDIHHPRPEGLLADVVEGVVDEGERAPVPADALSRRPLPS